MEEQSSRRGVPGPAPLTRQREEYARLAARGFSNSEAWRWWFVVALTTAVAIVMLRRGFVRGVLLAGGLIGAILVGHAVGLVVSRGPPLPRSCRRW